MNPVLVCGVKNTDADLGRFSAANHVILDRDSSIAISSALPSLSIDLSNLAHLEFLANKFPRTFSKIVFDWSVTQFVSWTPDHVAAIAKILKPEGELFYPFPFEIKAMIGPYGAPLECSFSEEFDAATFYIEVHIFEMSARMALNKQSITDYTAQRNAMILKAFRTHFILAEEGIDGEYPVLNRRDGKAIAEYLVASYPISANL